MDRNGCACSNSIAATIILVVAALIGVGWYQWEQSQNLYEAQQQAEREKLLHQVVTWAQEDIEEAEKWLEQDRAEMVLNTLRHTDEKLKIISFTANIEGDTEAGESLTILRAPIGRAIEALEGAADDTEALQAVRKHLQQARDSMGDYTSQHENDRYDQ